MADSTNGGTFIEKNGTAVALLLGLIIIAGAIYFGNPSAPKTGDEAGAPAAAVDIKDVKTEGTPFIGDEDAPVTVAVWFDYQCSFCKRFESTTLKDLKAEFVDSGKVKIVYKDFQFLGQASLDTAIYSHAVWEAAPDKWGTWFDAVMTGEGENTLSRAALDATAAGLGIDTARVATLITEKGGEYTTIISASRDEGATFGINGTPGSIIGTSLVAGAQPYTVVKPLVEAEL
ncbi:thioredoxin domain-containing protein [Patescibacteria group bacterium]|nr:thioredoxin domain-containing protein [Patescibacteria group bacterium]